MLEAVLLLLSLALVVLAGVCSRLASSAAGPKMLRMMGTWIHESLLHHAFVWESLVVLTTASIYLNMQDGMFSFLGVDTISTSLSWFITLNLLLIAFTVRRFKLYVRWPDSISNEVDALEKSLTGFDSAEEGFDYVTDYAFSNFSNPEQAVRALLERVATRDDALGIAAQKRLHNL
jgi:hypothetical protein